MRANLLIFLSIMLLGCETTYVPSGEFGGIAHGGYNDAIIGASTATVRFDGNRFTSPQLVHAYLLYRCAQVTQQSGYQYFTLTSTSYSPTNVHLRKKLMQYPIYPPSSSGSNFYTQEIVTSSYSSPSKANLCQRGACNAVSAVATIEMYDSKTVSGAARTYSASDIISHYGYLTN